MFFVPKQGAAINKAGCDIAREVANEGNALVLGGICQTPSFLSGAGKQAVQNEFRKQIDVFVASGVDFLLCEVRVFFFFSGFPIVWGRRNRIYRPTIIL